MFGEISKAVANLINAIKKKNYLYKSLTKYNSKEAEKRLKPTGTNYPVF